MLNNGEHRQPLFAATLYGNLKNQCATNNIKTLYMLYTGICIFSGPP